MFGLNAAGTLDEMRARVRPLLDGLGGGPRRAVFEWLRLVAPGMFPQSDAAGAVASLEREFPDTAKEEGTMMALRKRVLEWEAEWRRQGFEEGIKRGLERGLERGERRGIERGRAQVLAAERELLGWLGADRSGAGAH